MNRVRAEVLAYAAWIGAVMAMWRGYSPVIRYLLETLRRILATNSKIQFPVSFVRISSSSLPAGS